VTLFAEIDQSAARRGCRHALEAHPALSVWKPEGRYAVMEANPHAALELPLRAVCLRKTARRRDMGGLSGRDNTLERDYKVDEKLIAPLRKSRLC